MSESIHIRPATPEDAQGVADIYNPFIENSSVSFESRAVTVDEMANRIRNNLNSFPWLVAQSSDMIAGYAYANAHRSRAAYQWSAEVSAYIHPAFHGRGLGRDLYTNLFEILKKQNICNVLAGITMPNAASEKFHQKMGFKPVGTYREVGFKNGQWHDVSWHNLRLSETSKPEEFIAYSEVLKSFEL